MAARRVSKSGSASLFAAARIACSTSFGNDPVRSITYLLGRFTRTFAPLGRVKLLHLVRRVILGFGRNELLGRLVVVGHRSDLRGGELHGRVALLLLLRLLHRARIKQRELGVSKERQHRVADAQAFERRQP